MRDRRNERHLSQHQLARTVEALGLKMDDLAILRIEKNIDDPDGGRRVRLGEAAIIARALGTTLEDMLRPDPQSGADLLAVAEYELEKAQEFEAKAAADVAGWKSRIEKAHELIEWERGRKLWTGEQHKRRKESDDGVG